MKNSIHYLFLNVVFLLLSPCAYSDSVDHCINIICEKPIRDEIVCEDALPSEDTNEIFTIFFFQSRLVELGHLDCSYVHENGDVFSKASKYIENPKDYDLNTAYYGKPSAREILFSRIREQCFGDETCRYDRGCRLQFQKGEQNCWMVSL